MADLIKFPDLKTHSLGRLPYDAKEADVVPLTDALPHSSGPARCVSCRNEWVGDAPAGVIWIECPECLAHTGYFLGTKMYEGPHWHCACDNTLFHVTRDGVYCPHCGDWQTFPKEWR